MNFLPPAPVPRFELFDLLFRLSLRNSQSGTGEIKHRTHVLLEDQSSQLLDLLVFFRSLCSVVLYFLSLVVEIPDGLLVFVLWPFPICSTMLLPGCSIAAMFVQADKLTCC